MSGESASDRRCSLSVSRRPVAFSGRRNDAQQAFPGPWNEEHYSSWVIPLLPYLGEKERATGLTRYSEFDDRHQGGKSSLYGKPIPVLVCPSDELPPGGVYEYHSADPNSPNYNPTFPDGRYDAVSSYGANWGTQIFKNNPSQVVDKNGMFHYNTRTRVADVLDGISNTILFGERSHQEPRWPYMDTPVRRNKTLPCSPDGILAASARGVSRLRTSISSCLRG